ncbi:hypothetical protein EIN_370110 [Entamoeba invadens IP1]|uniref:Uncharacterized protein n=1 Tax=Entamoeba invadens IP1 TaxID=370355 RepID=A0A0A1UFG8_ENTIV|nr:hypothetical protein EIN_370110 [Entamoeba invadens IP1]ELP92669.1 hypothetical protein EIN_370110 [Entamoeba invadens IP1]|eukprot:XP_004259440.1 hypothetical protein EIN_370110 [Entamoeba invadens IP1]
MELSQSSSSLKKNTISKRESTQREYISNAALIGLANCYGASFGIKCPVLNNKSFINFDHFTITSSSLFPSFARIVDADRKTKKNEDAQIYNFIAGWLAETFELGSEARKTHSSKKQIGQVKYARMGPFSEKGFKEFGVGVIGIIRALPKTHYARRQNLATLDPYNLSICQLYNTLITEPENLYDYQQSSSVSNTQETQSSGIDEKQTDTSVQTNSLSMDTPCFYMAMGNNQFPNAQLTSVFQCPTAVLYTVELNPIYVSLSTQY